MDTQISVMYHLVIRGDEFRLLSNALRGLLADEDKPKALVIQEKMERDRHECLRQQFEAAQKKVDNIERAEQNR